MNWDFLDICGVVVDVVDLLGSNSSSNLDYNEKPKIKKKTKYFTEKASSLFLLIAAVLLFFVFKDPLSSENYAQTLTVASLIGLAISLLLFFVLYTLERYYFQKYFSVAVF